MRARAPASSANLGPGFDALALALGLWVEVAVSPAESLSVRTSGHGSELPADESHLAVRVAAEVLGHTRFDIQVHSDIPVGRGLGSSAGLAVAAAGAAGAGRQAAFELAARFDGHPENAGASAFGGLVGAARVGDVPVCERLPLDPALGFVVLVPERELSTTQARAALPPTVSHADAAFNLGRMALLVAGMADHSRLRPAAAEDRLHQRPRAALFPEAEALMKGLVQAGALASCWSGAGSSILGMVPASSAEALRLAGQKLLESVGLPGRALRLNADLEGLRVEP